MNILQNSLYKIAKTKMVQNICKKLSDPALDSKMDVFIPMAEPILAKTYYCIKVNNNKDMPEERKYPLILQSAITGIIGLTLGKKLNNLIKPLKNSFKEEIIKSALQNKEKLIKGVDILVPLMITSLLMRYLIPVLTVPFSVFMSKFVKKEQKDDLSKRTYSS